MRNPPLKTYSPVEEKINILSHLFGFLVSLTGGICVLLFRPPQTFPQTAGIVIYVLTLLFMYASSAFYHSRTLPAQRLLGRKLDHCAIFLLISGSYTGLLLLLPAGARAAVLLPVMWICAFVGILFKLCFFGRFQLLSVTLYLIMGWMILPYLGDLFRQIPRVSLCLLAAGGIAFTAGVLFYLLRVKYSHAVWHLFVLAGTTLQFLGIAAILF